jgi:3-dehydroquinate synthase
MHGSLTLPIRSRINDYSVQFTDNISDVDALVRESGIIAVIDSNVARLYPQLLHNDPIVVECIEDRKTLAGASEIFDRLVERKANIRTNLVVVGGGILQDLAGFCASTYCRGMQYMLVPTTLLAQADSCVGGKTSLNHSSRKNILGTFYPPSRIVVCPKFTETLTGLDYISGFGEIYKFHILQDKMEEFDVGGDLLKMIHDGLKYKIGIIEGDEFDRGERRFLNFGHTFGHAIESLSSYEIPHGIGVIVGSMIAMEVSRNLDCVNEKHDMIMEQGKDLISRSKIALHKDWFNLQELLPLVLADKKSTGKLTMVLMKEAKPFISEIADYGAVSAAIEKVYASI